MKKSLVETPIALTEHLDTEAPNQNQVALARYLDEEAPSWDLSSFD